jgi:hypothetical protein
LAEFDRIDTDALGSLMFQQLDANHHGKVGLCSYAYAIRYTNMSRLQFDKQDLYSEAQQNHSDMIEQMLNQLIAIANAAVADTTGYYPTTSPRAELIALFDRCDINGDGMLDGLEIQHLWAAFSSGCEGQHVDPSSCMRDPDGLEKLVADFGGNGQGLAARVTKEQFIASEMVERFDDPEAPADQVGAILAGMNEYVAHMIP